MRQVLVGGVLLVGVAIAAACGGNVVVDPPPGDGGSGGAPGPGPTTSQGGAGANCPVPPPVGDVFGCSGSAVSTGSGSQCDTFYCDEGGNTYTESCSGQACSCWHNGIPLCNCAIDGGGDICAGSARPCCPFPFAE
jgi:hypothetical protein